ncbi:NADH-quinone oxidoreductase subunit M, partial [Candidatus Sumerlaeota bacterium]|nr:NADH-quinone oxidoreductase subunit M [Candidatus Sumerlaeota bacterium]
MEKWLLTLITFLPTAGMAGVLCLPSNRPKLIQLFTVAVTGIEFMLTLYLVAIFIPTSIGTDPTNYKTWFDSKTFYEVPWIPMFNINYRVGVDGLSVILIALTGFLSFLVTFSAFTIKKQVKGFYALYLLLVTGMMGVFVSLDLLLFYVFWEIMLLPMYFLIGIWGGPRREYAAIKFFIYTLVGSVLILIVMLAFYFQMGKIGHAADAFNIPELIRLQPFGPFLNPDGTIKDMLQLFLFFGLFIGFAIKVPIFPFHTWLPDAHVEAPTPISVILAGVLLKMGGYGLLRLNWPLLPEVGKYLTTFMAIVALINIIYGALCAMGQTDFKKLVAYSSVSHMGYVLLGIAVLNTEGVNGAIFQMFTHGTSSAMMFLLVGVLYERAHHREINRFGGMALKMPVYFSLAMVGFFAALGLPGMSGFISEVMVFLGAFKERQTITAVATIGVV